MVYAKDVDVFLCLFLNFFSYSHFFPMLISNSISITHKNV